MERGSRRREINISEIMKHINEHRRGKREQEKIKETIMGIRERIDEQERENEQEKRKKMR